MRCKSRGLWKARLLSKKDWHIRIFPLCGDPRSEINTMPTYFLQTKVRDASAIVRIT